MINFQLLRNTPLSEKQVIWLTLVIALALRIAAVLFLVDASRLEYEYIEIAKFIINGYGYAWDKFGTQPIQPTSLFTPLYSYFLAILQITLGKIHYLGLFIPQAIISTTGTIPAYFLGTVLLSRRLGFIFSLLYAIWPEQVFLPTKLVVEFLYVPMALWLLYFYFKELNTEKSNKIIQRNSFLTGLFAGLILMFNASAILVVIPVALGWLYAGRKLLIHTVKRRLLPYCIGLSLLLIPWGIRNYVVQDKIIFLRTGFGWNLWMGNHPGGTGSRRAFEQDIFPIDQEYRDSIKDKIPNDEEERDLFFIAEAKKYISENPEAYVKLCVRRFIWFLWFDPTHPIGRNIIYRMGHAMSLLLAIIGIIILARIKKVDIIFLLIMLFHLALYTTTIVLPRYRIIIVTLYLLFSSVVIDSALDRILFKRNLGTRGDS